MSTNHFALLDVLKALEADKMTICCSYVQILRNHVMVRIGGGWDTLESYLDRHDPCRCNSKRTHLSVIILEDKRGIRLYILLLFIM